MKVLVCSATVAMLASITLGRAAVEISSKPTSNMTCLAGVCTPTAKKAVLNVTDLTTMLAGSDVSVKSDNLTQDIEIKAVLSWASAQRLTLDSHQSIIFSRPLEITGTGALSIATNDGGAGGDFRFFGRGHVEFWDTSSNLLINNKSYILVNSMQQMVDQLTQGVNFVALAKSLNAGRHQYTHALLQNLKGTFEGLGNRIVNLKIEESRTSKNAALFGNISKKGLVHNVHLDSVDISGNGEFDQLVGAVAGNNDGTISNVHVSGVITLNADHSTAGGLAGESDGTILQSSSNAVLTGLGPSITIGGLLGINYNVGEDTPSSVSECFSTGTVSAQNENGTNVSVGGLIGETVGGIVSNSYSRAQTSVIGSDLLNDGGLIGEAQSAFDPPPTISNSYSTGVVNGSGNGWTGGLLGEDVASANLTDAYWDLESSGIDDPSKGAGTPANDPGITGLTTVQFKSGLPAGFENKLWREDPRVNDGYPYLIANPPQ